MSNSAPARRARTIGLIGGLSWESSAIYYRLINEGVRDRLGPPHSASIVLWSFDFEEFERLQHLGDWAALNAQLRAAGERLARAGADLVLVCSNTMHYRFDELEQALSVPMIHIADAAGASLRQNNVKRVCLLGTRFTMEEPFYLDRLEQRFGLNVITPDLAQREVVHGIIYNELVAGKVVDRSRRQLTRIISMAAEAGAEAVILGCTELPMLISQADSSLPLYDTTALHASAAVDAALQL